MLHIERFVFNMIEENCYVVSDDTSEAVIVDCGAFFPKEKEALRSYVEKNKLNIKRLLNTHCHFDHIFGDEFVHEAYGICPEMHRDEAETYQQAGSQMRLFMHRDFHLATPPAGRLFQEGDLLAFGHHSLRVVHTPGHTPGGVCLYCEEEGILFSGDSIFRHEIGRTDLPGGNEAALIGSLKAKILTLPEATRIYPGHGEATSVGEEKRRNPYLR